MFLVEAARTDVRRHPGHRTPPLHRVDHRRGVGPTTPGDAGPAGRPRRDRLVPSGGRLDLGARGERGELTGPNPVDRGKPGSKIHTLADRTGLPLTALTSAANTHDAHLLVPLLDSLAPIRSRRGRRRARPDKLHGDKAYNNQYIRAELRYRRITIRLARPGIESSTRLGRHRWVIERTLSWLLKYRRLVRRYDRLAEHFQGFVTIACALICYRRLTKITK
jgi:transposase